MNVNEAYVLKAHAALVNVIMTDVSRRWMKVLIRQLLELFRNYECLRI